MSEGVSSVAFWVFVFILIACIVLGGYSLLTRDDRVAELDSLVSDSGYSVIVDGVEVSTLPDDVLSSRFNVSVMDEDKLIICTTRSHSVRGTLIMPMRIS